MLDSYLFEQISQEQSMKTGLLMDDWMDPKEDHLALIHLAFNFSSICFLRFV